jgi:phytol kinase
MLNPWAGMGVILTIFGLLLAGLGSYRRWRSPDPEVLRKLLHMGMGVVTLALPWLFRRPWPVLLLALLFAFGLATLRVSRSLQRLAGGVIDGVNRKSLGDIYFPVAVGLLFLLSGGDALTFCVPMLILTFADAAAALIGTRYGVPRGLGAQGVKSIEGSVAFFITAFLCVHISLLLFTDTGRAETLLVATTLALQVMLLEAFAWDGLDNLFIPLGGFFLLKTLLESGVTALLTLLGIAAAMTFCAWIRTKAHEPGRTNRTHPARPQAIQPHA